jgi:spore coat polysaccharide biosynthesis protein SpsF
MEYVAIVQARMGSTRLPGKVLLPLEGKPVLAHIVARLRRVGRIRRVVVATSVSPADDAIADWAAASGVDCVRGSETDVLDRFHQVSLAFPCDAYVRATGDNPMIDPQLLDVLLDDFEQRGLDYLGSTGYPLGTSAEVFRRAALDEAFHNATEPYESEHVTPYMYRRMMNWTKRASDVDLSDVRLTVDTPEDYDLARAVFGRFRDRVDAFTYGEVVDFLAHNPAVAEINSGIRQKRLGE